MKIKCPQCDFDVDSNETVCEICGFNLEDNPVSEPISEKLTLCNDCGSQISKRATTCPQCGSPNKPQESPKKKNLKPLIIVIVIIVLSAVSYHNHTENIRKAEKAAAIQKQIDKRQKDIAKAKRRADAKKRNEERAIERAQQDRLCKTDLECWGEKHALSATFASQKIIEKHAKYQFEWTDGWLGVKMSRFRWKNKSRQTLTYFGDQIKFQNGFGAWQNMTYQCDYDPINEKVLDVRVYPGRL